MRGESPQSRQARKEPNTQSQQPLSIRPLQAHTHTQPSIPQIRKKTVPTNNQKRQTAKTRHSAALAGTRRLTGLHGPWWVRRESRSTPLRSQDAAQPDGSAQPGSAVRHLERATVWTARTRPARCPCSAPPHSTVREKPNANVSVPGAGGLLLPHREAEHLNSNPPRWELCRLAASLREASTPAPGAPLEAPCSRAQHMPESQRAGCCRRAARPCARDRGSTLQTAETDTKHQGNH